MFEGMIPKFLREIREEVLKKTHRTDGLGFSLRNKSTESFIIKSRRKIFKTCLKSL